MMVKVTRFFSLLVSILIVISVLVSCTAKKNYARTAYVSEKKITSLAPVVVPHDSALVKAQLECDSLGRVYIKQINTLVSKNVALSTRLDSVGMMSTTMVARHDTIFIPVTSTSSVRIDTVTVYANHVKSTKLPLWQTLKCYFIAFIILVVICGVIYVVITIRKRKTFINF